MDELPGISFWASCLRHQKKIKVVVPDDITLHITKASLDGDATPGRNVVICRHGEDEPSTSETAVCVLSVDGTECFDLTGMMMTCVVSCACSVFARHIADWLRNNCRRAALLFVEVARR